MCQVDFLKKLSEWTNLDIYKDLEERGLIAQVTNLEKVREMLKNQKVMFYIGFDPTAPSLHVGSLLQILIMARLQRAGHIPIILFGGGTGMIGDPSGKTDMRKMLTKEEIDYNIARFKKQAEKFIDFSNGKAIVVNNADWLSKLNYIDFLREVGVHFSVNKMLAAECYKQRLEKGLSFFELNYMIMQSYDFVVLNRKYDCFLQLGGDDQWSNILGGVDLIRRMDRKEAYGLTFTLLTTSEGKKMGKTEKGALWLDPGRVSPYEFYQYWRNVDDKDVTKCMKILTFLPVDQINKYDKLEGQDLNQAKDVLAFEVTKLVHGEEESTKAQNAAKSIFGAGNMEDMPMYKISLEDLADEKIDILNLLVKSNLATSKSEARRLVEQGGITIDNQKIDNLNFEIDAATLKNGIVIKKGKKIYKKITL